MHLNQYKATVYHGTLDKSVQSILSDGFKPKEIKDTDNHWLGHGIYFFDSKELGEWWGITKATKLNKIYNKQYEPALLECVIQCSNDELADLDQAAHLDKFYKFWIKKEQELIKDKKVLDFCKGVTGSKTKVEQIIKEKNVVFI